MLHIEGWEGSLERLLEHVRARRFDLARVSITVLVDQYLAHVEGQDRPRLEIAAEYLVMAAWVTFLKSAALLPGEPEREPEPDAPVALARHRALRLAAMRDAAAVLATRARLGRDRHPRGRAEGLVERTRASPAARLDALVAAYARVGGRGERRGYAPQRRAVFTMADALAALRAALPDVRTWTALERLLPPAPSSLRRSARASTLAAALELARCGVVELRQTGVFAPIALRAA